MGIEDFYCRGSRFGLGHARPEIGQEHMMGQIRDLDGPIHHGQLLGALATADLTEQAVAFDQERLRAGLLKDLIVQPRPLAEAVDV
ncbi:MAG: hypothetical protein JW990_12195 [Thermoleophilia bacterium]|nr:hypothetical protein [Thermoleophilia bacterium]